LLCGQNEERKTNELKSLNTKHEIKIKGKSLLKRISGFKWKRKKRHLKKLFQLIQNSLLSYSWMKIKITSIRTKSKTGFQKISNLVLSLENFIAFSCRENVRLAFLKI